MDKVIVGKNIKYVNKGVNRSDIVSDWNVNIHCENDKSSGLRLPQYGALTAIQSHWTISQELATIVMPTGTGKTETMIMTIVSERIEKTIIVVPSDLLRKQTVEKVCSFGVLKDIDVVGKNCLSPNVALLKSVPKTTDDMDSLIEDINIIITTMSLVNKLSTELKEKLKEFADLLIVDEAHHIMANSWIRFRNDYADKKVIQFTATPFRNDGKRMDGRIIYNYPLRKAQEEGYFQKINFYPILEFNDKKSDYAIASKAVECLEKDLRNGKDHILLVRTTKIKRAELLYEEIYKTLYSQYNPVLIVSNMSAVDKKRNMKQIKEGISRIIVCVDMFGEGIDIPNLKIAAIHDKYQSLPITLQFVGRFARSQNGLGDASVITNIADDSLKESLNELYAQDSDWNVLLSDMSEKAIGRELSLQELEKGFNGNGIDEISIKQIRPKVSMQAFTVNGYNPMWDNWKQVFDEEKCKYYLNNDQNILVIIEAADTKLEWTNYKEISNLNWELHVVYYNSVKKVVCINSSVKGVGLKLAESIFGEAYSIRGDCVFRCMHGINRLMLGTVGLNSAFHGPVRYKMFAGVDIAQGINEAQKSNNTKSNLFGVGYDGNGKVSIGCSYKGTIWSRWVENIDYWVKWCDTTLEKIMDSSIDVGKILEGVLIPNEVFEFPQVPAYRIDWPIDLEMNNDYKTYIQSNYEEVPLFNCSIRLLEQSCTDSICFVVETESFFEKIKYSINNEGYTFSFIDGDYLKIHYGRKDYELVDFFKENPPRIKFIDQSTIEGNYYITMKDRDVLQFPSELIESWDWANKGVDIRVESQGPEKKKNSIQYCIVQSLLVNEDIDIIFDDDNAGEIADIIAVQMKEDEIEFEFYHCKYSHSSNPGHRILDLYEVCGQAEKSVEWKQDMRNLIERMMKRENKRLMEGKNSRFEKGTMEVLGEIRNKLKIYPSSLKICIVQPGVSAKEITNDMHQVLMASKIYLQETYGIKLRLICS